MTNCLPVQVQICIVMVLNKIVFFIVVRCFYAFCCEYNTFQNTTVTLVGVRGVDSVSGCFKATPALEKVSLIQIVNERVPILYEGAFSNLENLVDIILEDIGIKQIYPGAFNNLTKIYCIRVKNNNIYEIPAGIFNNLLLSELNLVNNSINVIQPTAFDDMPNLSIILLNDNNLRHWNSDWFTNTPRLTIIDFSENCISALPAKAFKNVAGSHVVKGVNVTTNVYLSSNNIRHIDSTAFENLEVLGWLYLDKNQLTVIDERVFTSFRQLDWLKLDYNKLSCVPEKLIQLVPNVKYYLEGNPLSDDCKTRFDIKLKNGNALTPTKCKN